MASTAEGKHTDIVTGVTHLRKHGNSLSLTVPKEIRSALDWAEGEALLICAEDNCVTLESLVEHMAQAAAQNEEESNIHQRR